jgi:undecaprenyl-diphosphatase
MKPPFQSWEPRAIGSLLIVAASAWAFFWIADLVVDGETHATDTRLLLAFRDPHDLSRLRGPAWLPEVARDITALGGWAVLSLTTLAVVGFLFLSDRSREARFVLTAVAGGLALGYGLKFLFDRPRPEIVPHLSIVKSSSFPSTHSLMAGVTYLTLGSLLTSVVTTARLKWYLLGVALMLTVLVGISRVWVGVHYPSDVVAGWAVGLLWAEACWLLHHRLKQRSERQPAEHA